MADQLRGDALFSYAVEHYLDTVYRAAFHAAPSPQDAEDVTQEVFEALLRSGKRFREPNTCGPGCCGSPSTSAKTSTGPSAGRRCP